MSESIVPPRLSHAKRTPIVEFRRWLIVASTFAVIGGCIPLMLSKLGSGVLLDRIALLTFWGMFAFGEGWVQFDQTGRRVAWCVVGCLTFALSMLVRGDAIVAGLLICLIPAVLESAISLHVRNRPWTWLVATPLIYGSIRFWGRPLDAAVSWMIAFITNTSGLSIAINQDMARLATFFAVILIARATVGSFIASRKAE